MNVGDRVVVVTNDDLNGRSGTIDRVYIKGYSVVLDGGRLGAWFSADEVRLPTALDGVLE